MEDLRLEGLNVTRHRWTRAQFDQFVEIGVLREDDHIELIRGEVIRMSPMNPPHIYAASRLARRLGRLLDDSYEVISASSYALSDDSEPEPDIAVVPAGGLARKLPDNALLVVEVAETSLRYDRVVKAPLYAEAGIPEYWIVNLVDGCVEVHLDPQGGLYRRTQSVGRDGTLRPGAFPQVAIAVAEILPPIDG